ncbi:MAG: arylsulfatase [Pirellulales bacterium]
MRPNSFRCALVWASVLAAACAIVALVDAPASAAAQSDGDRPNIVLIMVDDMGFSDIGCYGGEIDTPNVDRLAAEGLRFRQFYNAARCCPTRASLLTGLYPHQAGIGLMTGNKGYPAYQGYLNEHCVTLGEALKRTGYHTLMSGKWHVGAQEAHLPSKRGFEETFVLPGGASNYWDVPLKRNGKTWKQQADPYWKDRQLYTTDAFSDFAARFIDEYARKDDPYFLYLAYTAPHFPLHAWPEDIEKYDGRFDKGWDRLRRECYRRQLEMGLIDESWPLSPRHGKIKPFENVAAEKKKEMLLRMQVYAAQVDRMDQGVGKVVEALEKSGEFDDTLLIFISDNGGNGEGGPWGWGHLGERIGRDANFWSTYGSSWGNLSNTPFRLFKHYIQEGGISSPMIVRWPGVVDDRGGFTDQPGHVMDLMATFLDVAGAEYPNQRNGHDITPLEGKSLLPVFQGEQRDGHEAIGWEHHGNRGLRMGKWKLVAAHNDPWALYNMEEDRTELNDLAEEHPARLKRMKARYQQWADRVGVRPWPLKKKDK